VKFSCITLYNRQTNRLKFGEKYDSQGFGEEKRSKKKPIMMGKGPKSVRPLRDVRRQKVVDTVQPAESETNSRGKV